MPKNTIFQNFAVLIVLISLVACAPGSPTPAAVVQALDAQPTPTSEQQASSTATPTQALAPSITSTQTSTPSATPTLTNTPTLTPTFTPSATPTETPTPLPVRTVPGMYLAGGCVKGTTEAPFIQVDFCVTSVEIKPNRNMVFYVSWTLLEAPQAKISKLSDQNNANMYLKDIRGNRYDHVGGGGAAYSRTSFRGPYIPLTGWFEFNPAPDGVFSFSFYDDDTKIVVANISLLSNTMAYKEFALQKAPFFLQYRHDLWEVKTAEAGGSFLEHKKLTGCRLEEHPQALPQGALKNTIAIGEITYQIYGYLDQPNNLGYREYLPTKGLPELAESPLPLFLVAIPLDASQACILDASEVLARLFANTP